MEITDFTCEWLTQNGEVITEGVSDDTKSITIDGVDFGQAGYIRYGCRAILPET
jgi:hypothetical protein